jgi:hypothetical protein
MPRKPKLAPKVKAALESVIEYNWPQELRDAKEQLRENGTLDGHIFSCLVTLDNWLKGTDGTPTSYVEGDMNHPDSVD